MRVHLRPLFVAGVLLVAIPACAQEAPKSIALTERSNIPTEEMLKSLRKGCPDVTITQDLAKSDYIVDAVKKPDSNGGVEYRLVLSDHNHKILGSSEPSLAKSVRDICHAMVGALIVEVVDSQNLTQSQDTRGDTSGGAAGAVINGLTGRRTHTDNSMVYVIINGEHALLDCYERRKGCTTIGPGKYTGERDGNSIWISYEMPVTHQPVRNHYKIAGGW